MPARLWLIASMVMASTLESVILSRACEVKNPGHESKPRSFVVPPQDDDTRKPRSFVVPPQDDDTRRLPYSSTETVCSGQTTVVESYCSTTQGPSKRWPARSRSRA